MMLTIQRLIKLLKLFHGNFSSNVFARFLFACHWLKMKSNKNGFNQMESLPLQENILEC